MEISLPAWLEIRAHIGFICTFRFTPFSLPLSHSRSFARACAIPLTGASQFYRHVPCPFPVTWSHPTLSSISRFTNRRLTEGEVGCLALGHHPRSPQFPTPRTTKRVERHDPSLVTRRTVVPPTHNLTWLFSFHVFFPLHISWPR